MSRWSIPLLFLLLGSCECGETTTPANAPATEGELIKAMTETLCTTELASGMTPLLRRETGTDVSPEDSEVTRRSWSRLFWEHGAHLAPFVRSRHLANDVMARKRMAKGTLEAVWRRCASHVSAHLGQGETGDLERLFARATGDARPTSPNTSTSAK